MIILIITCGCYRHTYLWGGSLFFSSICTCAMCRPPGIQDASFLWPWGQLKDIDAIASISYSIQFIHHPVMYAVVIWLETLEMNARCCFYWAFMKSCLTCVRNLTAVLHLHAGNEENMLYAIVIYICKYDNWQNFFEMSWPSQARFSWNLFYIKWFVISSWSAQTLDFVLL